MRFKKRRNAPPTIDLIPMLNVMMSVLAFFVLVSTLLATAPAGLDVVLPADEETEANAVGTSMLVTLAENQILIEDQPVGEELMPQIQAYLSANAEAVVVLVAEPEVPYERVIQLLAQMRDVGGDRVSLGLELKQNE